MNWEQFTNLIQDSLTDDLLDANYRKIKEQHPDANEAFGHCYVATEAAYHLLGGKAEGWAPQFVRVAGYPHWYLKHQSGFIYDPTASQFKIAVPYHQGKGKGFLTKQPSKRCKQLVRQIDRSRAWISLKIDKTVDTQFPQINLDGGEEG
jgi:hypothetical protein